MILPEPGTPYNRMFRPDVIAGMLRFKKQKALASFCDQIFDRLGWESPSDCEPAKQ
jgi:hypothetical protein